MSLDDCSNREYIGREFIIYSDRIHRFLANTNSEMMEWIMVLQNVIDRLSRF